MSHPRTYLVVILRPIDQNTLDELLDELSKLEPNEGGSNETPGQHRD